jgi:hydroxymethylglutaryl-CoA reductase
MADKVDDPLEKLKIENEALKREIEKLTATLKEQYEFQWLLRQIMLPIVGVDCKQTDDLRGITLSTGEFASYGKEYHTLYFLGRIRELGGGH